MGNCLGSPNEGTGVKATAAAGKVTLVPATRTNKQSSLATVDTHSIQETSTGRALVLVSASAYQPSALLQPDCVEAPPTSIARADFYNDEAPMLVSVDMGMPDSVHAAAPMPSCQSLRSIQLATTPAPRSGSVGALVASRSALPSFDQSVGNNHRMQAAVLSGEGYNQHSSHFLARQQSAQSIKKLLSLEADQFKYLPDRSTEHALMAMTSGCGSFEASEGMGKPSLGQTSLYHDSSGPTLGASGYAIHGTSYKSCIAGSTSPLRRMSSQADQMLSELPSGRGMLAGPSRFMAATALCERTSAPVPALAVPPNRSYSSQPGLLDPDSSSRDPHDQRRHNMGSGAHEHAALAPAAIASLIGEPTPMLVDPLEHDMPVLGPGSPGLASGHFVDNPLPPSSPAGRAAAVAAAAGNMLEHTTGGRTENMPAYPAYTLHCDPVAWGAMKRVCSVDYALEYMQRGAIRSMNPNMVSAVGAAYRPATPSSNLLHIAPTSLEEGMRSRLVSADGPSANCQAFVPTPSQPRQHRQQQQHAPAHEHMRGASAELPVLYLAEEARADPRVGDNAAGAGHFSDMAMNGPMPLPQPELPVLMMANEDMPPSMRRIIWRRKHFRTVRQLHNGYASRVYEARCTLSGHTVALKVYKLAGRSDLERLHLFREITLHARIKHPNIVQFYAAFKEDNDVCIVTEFVRGYTLRQLARRHGGIIPERALVSKILRPCISALGHLHANGILHRDIKSDNIVMGMDGMLRLLDFGLAIDIREEIANTRAGTLAYMAPEILLCATKNEPRDYDKAAFLAAMRGSIASTASMASKPTSMVAGEASNSQAPVAWARGVRGSVPRGSKHSTGHTDELSIEVCLNKPSRASFEGPGTSTDAKPLSPLGMGLYAAGSAARGSGSAAVPIVPGPAPVQAACDHGRGAGVHLAEQGKTMDSDLQAQPGRSTHDSAQQVKAWLSSTTLLPRSGSSEGLVPKDWHYGPGADAWALGCLTYEMLIGRTPFANNTEDGIIENIATGQVHIPPHLSRGARHFIKATLTFEAGARPGMPTLAQHTWISPS